MPKLSRYQNLAKSRKTAKRKSGPNVGNVSITFSPTFQRTRTARFALKGDPNGLLANQKHSQMLMRYLSHLLGLMTSPPITRSSMKRMNLASKIVLLVLSSIGLHTGYRVTRHLKRAPPSPKRPFKNVVAPKAKQNMSTQTTARNSKRASKISNGRTTPAHRTGRKPMPLPKPQSSESTVAPVAH